MIKINLLPQEMAGARAGGAESQGTGTALVALILLILFGADLAIGGYLFFTYTSVDEREDQIEAEAAQVQAELEEVESQYTEVNTNLERMQKLIQVAEALDPPDRLLWSRKLNQLPLLVPDGVFMTQLNVNRQVNEVETEASIKRRNEWEKEREGSPPTPVKVPVYTQTLNLHGVAHVDQGSETQRLQQIVQFHSKLMDERVTLPFDEEPSRFIDGFTPRFRLSPVSTGQIMGREVSEFIFTIDAKKMKVAAGEE